MKLRSLVKQFRIDEPERFRLADHNPAETAGFEKGEAKELACAESERMTYLQQRLYAAHSWALLIVLQGVDAVGKDSAIKQVMAGLNPQIARTASMTKPRRLLGTHSRLIERASSASRAGCSTTLT